MNYKIKKCDKLHVIKMKYACSTKDIFKEMKRQDINWEKVFAKHMRVKRIRP